MTTFFNQIVPRLARTLGHQAGDKPAAESEFTVKPAHEIKETAEAWGLTVHLPGVTKEGLELTAVVRHVLIHEIGHHFGFSDDDMEAIEAQAPD